MSNTHACNHMSTIMIVVFSYHCHVSNTDNNDSHPARILKHLSFACVLQKANKYIDAIPDYLNIRTYGISKFNDIVQKQQLKVSI